MLLVSIAKDDSLYEADVESVAPIRVRVRAKVKVRVRVGVRVG